MQRQNALWLGQAQTFYGFALSALRTERRARRAVKKQNALRQQLAQCIAEQQYEECAALRDRIRALEKEETQHDGE